MNAAAAKMMLVETPDGTRLLDARTASSRVGELVGPYPDGRVYRVLSPGLLEVAYATTSAR